MLIGLRDTADLARIFYSYFILVVFYLNKYKWNDKNIVQGNRAGFTHKLTSGSLD